MESPKRQILFRKTDVVDTIRKPKVDDMPDRPLKPERPKPVKVKQEPIPEPKSARQYTHKLSPKLRRYKAMCNKKGIPFTLTPQQFDEIVSQVCTYCGDPGGSISMGEPNIGYVIENSFPCCSVCSTMKGTLPSDIFLKKVAQIGKRKEIF